MSESFAGRIVLVRHGETEANRLRRFAESDDIALTDEGIRQARELASRISREFRPARVFTSPFLRARQTAGILALKLDLESEVVAELHERNFGCLRGEPYERMGELMLADPDYDADRPWLWEPSGGESPDAVRRRVMPALNSLRSRRLLDAVVVCHGAVIQAACAEITGEWRESFVPPNCGFVELSHGTERWLRPRFSGTWEDLAAVAL